MKQLTWLLILKIIKMFVNSKLIPSNDQVVISPFVPLVHKYSCLIFDLLKQSMNVDDLVEAS